MGRKNFINCWKRDYAWDDDFLVSSSISATSAQHELTNTQQSVAKEQNRITDLRQEIGELTSTTRLNKIAREKGLTLINKNIRTIR